MEAEPTRVDAEDLLAQASWLGALARRLVDDRSQADDIVQNTWLAALRRPPESDRPLRPWLARVARNFARQARRGHSSRRSREDRSAREHDVHAPRELSPDELAGRLEGQRLLVEALTKLRDPYRSTILLHYFEHRSLVEIARLQGTPEGTVRWRLKQAIDELRAELDRRAVGERKAWMLLLVPLTKSGGPLPAGPIGDARPAGSGGRGDLSGAGPAAALPMALQGVFTMSSLGKIGIAATGVLCAFAGLSMLGFEPLAIFSHRDAAPAREVLQFRPIEPGPVLESQDPSRESPRAAAISSPARAAGSAPVGHVAARFIDARGRPIAGVGIQCDEVPLDPEPLSGGDGRVDLAMTPFPERSVVHFVAYARGWTSRALTAPVELERTTQLGDIELVPGGAVSGWVRDREGRAIEGAIVGISIEIHSRRDVERRRRMNLAEGIAHVRSGADGSFRIDGAPAGFVQVVAGARGMLKTFSGSVEVRAGQESSGLVLVLETIPDDELIRLVVLDPAGKPVAHARLGYELRGIDGGSSGSFYAGADGRSVLIARSGETYALSAKDPDERFAAATAKDVRGGTEVVLQFQLVREIELLLRARDGSPITSYRVTTTSDPNLLERPEEWWAGGRVRVPDHQFVVRVEAEGHRAWISPTFAPDRAAGRTSDPGPADSPPRAPEKLEVVLDPMPCLRGQAFTDAAPASGVRVSAWRACEMATVHKGFPVRVDPQAIARATSDAEGRFVLTVRRSGMVYVRLEADGFAPTELGAFEYDPERGLEGVDARLARGGTIEGSVIAGSGRNPAGMIVGFSRGDAQAVSVRVGEDGHFHAEHLTPGRWSVVKLEEEIRPEAGITRFGGPVPREIPWNCEVFEGRTTHFDVAPAGAACELAGTLTVDGAPPGAWRLDLFEGTRLHAQHFSSATLDPDGEFTLTAPGSGRHRLSLDAIEGRLSGARLMVDVDIGEGRSRWNQDLRTAELRVEGLDRVRAAASHWILLSICADGVLCLRDLSEGPSIDSPTLVVPVGRARIVSMDANGTEPDPRRWNALAEVEVTERELAHLRAP